MARTEATAVRALVLADTHLAAAAGLDRMPKEVWELAMRADLILHAGDVTSAEVLDALAVHAPTHAVLGNNDVSLTSTLPIELELQIASVDVAMVHDAGAATGRGRRMARRFPSAEVVIFGHSHQPLVDRAADGPILFNPGSPTQRRRQPVHTVGWLELAQGAVVRAEIIEVGPLASTS